ncbi:MAG: hypothetical protein LC797_15025 [Chloroflexi bacterium]|nr:hypothetical protein [Chloroflexota bacterium]
MHGGFLVDGVGSPGVLADVGVQDGRIAAVGAVGGSPAVRRLDARPRGLPGIHRRP